MTKDKKIAVWAIVLAALGVVSIFFGLTRVGFLKEMFVAIGQAMLGSGVVGFFIDRAAKVAFIQEAVRDAFGYIVGDNLPFALKHKIDEIVHTGLVNEDFIQN